MPLVIKSLRGGHTHTNTHTYKRLHRNNFKKPGALAYAPFKTGSMHLALVDLKAGWQMKYRWILKFLKFSPG